MLYKKLIKDILTFLKLKKKEISTDLELRFKESESNQKN